MEVGDDALKPKPRLTKDRGLCWLVLLVIDLQFRLRAGSDALPFAMAWFWAVVVSWQRHRAQGLEIVR